MPLQHYDDRTKHIAPGAATNDILVYNGSDFDAKSRESSLTGVTLDTLTVKAFITTTTLTIFGHAAAGQQAVINAVALTSNYANEYAGINTKINEIITKLQALGLTA